MGFEGEREARAWGLGQMKTLLAKFMEFIHNNVAETADTGVPAADRRSVAFAAC